MQKIVAVLKTLRVRRWYINSFVVFGSLLAAQIHHIDIRAFFPHIAIAVIAACILSSANYALNEALDAESDRHHPEKNRRAVSSGTISKTAIYILAAGLYAICAIFIFQTHATALIIAFLLFFFAGITYNVPPIRLKDIPYLDFISESINYPIRLTIGWFAVTTAIFPSSMFIALWAFAMFLMAAKRFAEFRFINDREQARLYRKSFGSYTEQRLLLAMVGSVSAFMFMLGVVTVKYQKNLVVALPLFIIFIVWLCAIAYQKYSFIKDPEQLLTNKYFLVYLALLALAVIALALYPHDIIHF